MSPDRTERDPTMHAARRWTVAIAAIAAPLFAQSPDGREIPTNKPIITVPFTPVQVGRVKQFQLYLSTDQGHSWQFVAKADPTARAFPSYTCPVDGSYWFALRTIDINDQAVPATLDGLAVALKVVLDRKPPMVMLRPAVNPGVGLVGVEWDVREEHINPARFTLDYRIPGRTDWLNQPGELHATGKQLWEWAKPERMDVRLRVADEAGNEAEQIITLSGNGATPTGNSNGAAGSNSSAGVAVETRYINSPVIGIPYRIREVGVSKLSAFDLWVTRDGGRKWEKVAKSGDAGLPDAPGDTLGDGPNRKMLFDTLRREGLYGFTMVVRSGVGIGDADPKPGDPPRLSVEVDLTPPVVKMSARPGKAEDVRNVRIEWEALDKHFGDKPVTLLVAESKDATDWTPIASDLDRAGTYTWSVGERGPFKFYIQVKAVDRAGNIGTAVSQDQIVVDLSRPKVDIMDVEPVPESRKP